MAWHGLHGAHGSLIWSSSTPSFDTIALVVEVATTFGAAGAAALGCASWVIRTSPWAILNIFDGGSSTNCTLYSKPSTCWPAVTGWIGLATHPNSFKAAATEVMSVPHGNGPTSQDCFFPAGKKVMPGFIFAKTAAACSVLHLKPSLWPSLAVSQTSGIVCRCTMSWSNAALGNQMTWYNSLGLLPSTLFGSKKIPAKPLNSWTMCCNTTGIHKLTTKTSAWCGGHATKFNLSHCLLQTSTTGPSMGYCADWCQHSHPGHSWSGHTCCKGGTWSKMWRKGCATTSCQLHAVRSR